MKLKDNKAIFFLVILLNLILVLSFNYIVGSDLKENKYLMNDFSMCFVKEDKDENIDFDFLLNFKDVSIVGEVFDKSVLGIFDPSMKYYVSANKRVNLSYLRYFSMEDYKNKLKTKIELTNFRNGNFSHKKDGKGFLTINYFFDGSSIFRYGGNEALNFFLFLRLNIKRFMLMLKIKKI